MDPEYRKHLQDEAKKAPPCPLCASTKIVPIGFGVAAFIASEESDLVVCHGGYIEFGVTPCWSCKDCKHEFGVVEADEKHPIGTAMCVD